jgi:hypothetical protein
MWRMKIHVRDVRNIPVTRVCPVSVSVEGEYLVIVWIASFPRSGNTFLRIVLHRYFGIRTSVVYDVDGVAERVGSEFIGFQDRTASYDEMRRSGEVYFVKTHRQRDDQIHEGDKAICVVRDGRDALVSWARQRSESDPRTFEAHLQEMISTRAERGTGGWGQNILSWLLPSVEHRIVLKYVDLIAEPAVAVMKTVKALGLDRQPRPEAIIPRFTELNQMDDGFFRRGINGSYLDEMPDELHDRLVNPRQCGRDGPSRLPVVALKAA